MDPGPPPAPPAPPYSPYPPAAPKKTSPLVIAAVVIVILVVLVAVVMAVFLFLLGGLIGPDVTQPPVVAFTRSMDAGNATLTVAGLSRTASIALFSFRLDVGFSSSGTTSFAASGTPRPTSVGGTTYQVLWLDQDSDTSLSLTDTILVAGDGVPLGAGSYVYRLVWAPTNAVITSSAWTV